MRRVMFVAAMAVATTATAGPVSFGQSWDGNPPGTIATIDRLGAGAFSLGLPDFGQGVYRLTMDGGVSALRDVDVLGFEAPGLCAGGCALQHDYMNGAQHVSTVLEVSIATPWDLYGVSPFTGRTSSTGSQFVFAQTSATTWDWGFEDLPLTWGDRDYQDLFGTITFERDIDPCEFGCAPVPFCVTDCTPNAVPEPGTLILLGAGLLIGAKVLRRR